MYPIAPVRADAVAMGMSTGAFSCQLVALSVASLRMLYTRQLMHVVKAVTLASSHHLWGSGDMRAV